jgi:hypothetical protein
MVLFGPVPGEAVPANCGLVSPAFCENFDQGPSVVRGRAGDLNPSRWSAGRLAPSDFIGPVVNPVKAASIPSCRSTFSGTSVYPPDDTLVCDPSGTRSAQLMTAIVIQNYGNNSYLIRQPFDFANRTGKIVFDVDAVSASNLGTWVAIDITEDPVPAPQFREAENFESGPVPRSGLMLQLNDNCGSGVNAIRLGNVHVYNNYARTVITPSFTVGGTTCPRTRQGSLNHFEVRLSQSQVEIWGSDFSTDDGATYPNFRRIYTASINLPFSRGYVHIAARNHASAKYGFGPGSVYRWDNIGFDGPVIADWRAYEIRDNTTMGQNPADGNATVRNLGYRLLDGTTGKPAGIYDPNNAVGPLQFQSVDISGAVSARLTLNAFFNSFTRTAATSWGVNVRFNGGPWRTRSLTATEVQALNTPGSAGNLTMMIDVPVGDLRQGTNAMEMVPVNAPMDYPPAVTNIDLVLALGAAAPAPDPPANLRISP